MNVPVSRDMATLLENASVATFGTDMFIGRLPQTPVNCLALYDMQGSPVLHIETALLDQWRVQVIVRNEEYDAGYIVAASIEAALNGRSRTDIGNNRYPGIHRDTTIFFRGFDEQNRAEFIQFFRGTRVAK